MKKPIFFILLSLFSLTSNIINAQEAIYSKTIANYNSDFMLPAENNSILIFGHTPFICKLNANGQVLWTKSYQFNNITSNSITPRFYEACYDLDSNIVSVGITASPTYTGNAFILKLKTNGDTLWCRKLTNTNIISFVPYDISVTNDSAYIITGCAYTNIINAQRLFITKISKKGNIIWSKLYSNSNYPSYGCAIQQSPDSGFVVTGSFSFLNPLNWLILVSKFDKNGNHQWTQLYAENNIPSNSGFDISINKNDFTVLSSTFFPGILNFSYSGNLNWSKFYNIPISFANIYNNHCDSRLRRTHKKGYLIFYKYIALSPSRIMETDSLGNPNWAFNSFVSKIDAIQNKDKTFNIVGNGNITIVPMDPNSNSFIQQGIQLFKIDSSGVGSQGIYNCYYPENTVIANVTFSNSTTSFTASNIGVLSALHPTLSNITLVSYDACLGKPTNLEENEFSSLTVSPNPADEKIRIESGQFIGKKINVQLVDVAGKIILNQDLFTEKEFTEIDCRNIHIGVYILKIFESGVMTKTTKIVIAH